MSLIDVIRRRSITIAVERRQGITVVDGFQVPGSPLNFNIEGHIQQAQRKDLANLPEGQRTQDWRVLWTATELLVADRVTDGGIAYVIQSIEDWNLTGPPDGEFFKALMTKVADVIP